MAFEMLDAMAKGGIYDQIEGGFFCYLIDERWNIGGGSRTHLFAQKSLLSYQQIVAHPSSYPYAVKVMLGSEFGYVLLRSKRRNLIANKVQINIIRYPYLLTKVKQNVDLFLACKIDRCFSTDRNISKVVCAIEGK